MTEKVLFTSETLTIGDMVNMATHELPLTFMEYQDAAKKTAIYRSSINEYVATLDIKDKVKEQDLVDLLCKLYTVLGLVGEAGEIANKFKKIIRDNKGEISVENEIGITNEFADVQWYIAAGLEEFNTSLDTAAKDNINKLLKRKENGTIGGSGDER